MKYATVNAKGHDQWSVKPYYCNGGFEPFLLTCSFAALSAELWSRGIVAL